MIYKYLSSFKIHNVFFYLLCKVKLRPTTIYKILFCCFLTLFLYQEKKHAVFEGEKLFPIIRFLKPKYN